jgi:hypothetical protein
LPVGNARPLTGVVSVILLTGCASGAPMRGGPLAEPGLRMGEAVLMDVGQTGTYGAETLTNHGREDVVLDHIDFLGRTSGLELLRPFVMHVRTTPGVPALAVGFIRQYPPPHEGAALHPIAGFRIAPHQSWKDDVELLIGFRAHRAGLSSYRAFEVHYHVAEKRYVTRFPDPLAVCVPRSFPLRRCKSPGGPR